MLYRDKCSGLKNSPWINLQTQWLACCFEIPELTVENRLERLQWKAVFNWPTSPTTLHSQHMLLSLLHKMLPHKIPFEQNTPQLKTNSIDFSCSKTFQLFKGTNGVSGYIQTTADLLKLIVCFTFLL